MHVSSERCEPSLAIRIGPDVVSIGDSWKLQNKRRKAKATQMELFHKFYILYIEWNECESIYQIDEQVKQKYEPILVCRWLCVCVCARARPTWCSQAATATSV